MKTTLSSTRIGKILIVDDCAAIRRAIHSIVALFLFGGAVAQAATYTLGTTNLLEGPSGGSNSVVLAVNPSSGTWTANANASWLHLNSSSQSGTGSANVLFSVDANTGSTRSGTVTISGQTLTVTQAGSTFVATRPLTTLISGIASPEGVAVDGSGNVYAADEHLFQILQWSPANNSVMSLVSSGLDYPYGLRTDSAGDVFIADANDNEVKEWSASTKSLSTVVSTYTGKENETLYYLYNPEGVAVDGSGNLYIADTFNSAIEEWTAGNSFVNLETSSAIYDPPYSISSNQPTDVAVDAAGNVYYAYNAFVYDTYGSSWLYGGIEKRTPGGNYSAVVASNLDFPTGLAVDGSGNVFFSGTNTIMEWSPANNSVTTLVGSGISEAGYVAVDAAGNVYFSDTGNNVVEELPNAFVNTSGKSEGAGASQDTITVLPASVNLSAPFAPGTDQSWLTIAGITNGVVTFGFSGNSGASRTGHVTILGQTITVTQGSASYTLATNSVLASPNAGSSNVFLTVNPSNGPWTATANVSWLSPASQSGTGSGNVTFSFPANTTGSIRTGTMTIGNQTLTITQASATLSANSRTESPVAASDSVSLTVNPVSAFWSNVPNATWLHLSGANQTGTGNSVITFTFDNNPGASRVGTLTIAGQTLTVTQNAATYAISTNGLSEGPSGGSDSVVLTVSPTNTPWTNLANASWLSLPAPDQSGVGSTNVTFNFSANVIGAPRAGTLTIGGQTLTITQGPATYAVSTNAFSTGPNAGSNSVSLTVVPSTALWTNTANCSWLHLSAGNVSGDGSTNVSFSFDANTTGVSRMGTLTIAGQTVIVAQGPATYTIGASVLSENAGAGTDSVSLTVVPSTAVWTNTANVSWLHLSVANSSGDGSTNVIFTFDANPGPTRSGTLTIGGMTVTVTQGVAVAPPRLTSAQWLGNGVFQFSFTNSASTFLVLSTTNLALPTSNWTVFATLTNDGSCNFQFTSPATTNDTQRYYTVRAQ